MAIINFTGNASHKTYEELFCLAEVTGGIHNQLKCLSVLNIFLSITAFLGNTLILVALQKVSSLHPPSRLLLRNLATTDLCIGIIAEPLAVIYWLSAVNERWDICRFAVVASSIRSYMLCLVSVLTLAAISVNRLLVLSLGLRYRQVVTLRRTCLPVFAFWFVSTVAFTMHLWDYRISYWYGYIVI